MTEFDPKITGIVKLLRRGREKHSHSLEQIEGKDHPRPIVLEPGETIIGRAPDCAIRLSSSRASRHHAALRLFGTECQLCDKESDNGVFLNGIKIHSAVLRDGDVIQLADTAFIYYED
ncbi:MAG TPA: FHA domain-containing protein [Verrucomicrobiae bacterium]|jgi:pSer/pThr/pTyr-binding forkhead associated (FHA) protein|nr:FHA domain-containing protein [Verrucomicrobiae bacterium]